MIGGPGRGFFTFWHGSARPADEGGRQPPATVDDMSAAALQFVRKVSGYRKPSRANEKVFERAVAEVTASVERLLTNLEGSTSTSSKHAVGQAE